MYRTYVIVRHTFQEAVVQPIYTLLLVIGAGILLLYGTGFGIGALPFFTLGEDTLMFKSVGLDVILILVLIATLFVTSKSIFEEIEDRTMLTLMSKPVKRWEVLVGKYLGIVLAALLAVAILGVIFIFCTWWRIPEDYMLRADSINDLEQQQLAGWRAMHIAGLVPSLLLVWLQISVLAAIGVALSTRVSLVVNLPVVILLYIAGNLMRFFAPEADVLGVIVYVFSLLLPYLEVFDLRDLTVYARIGLEGTQFAEDPTAVAYSAIWLYLGLAAVYAAAYAAFALSAGMWLFQNRELGGGEG